MSAARSGSTANAPEPTAWWIVGGPCALVIAMLLLGAVLRSPANGSQPVQPAPRAQVDRVDLAGRAAEDAARLLAHEDEWTLQFMVACEARTLEPIVIALADQPGFFLLRHPEFGGECYRVCWGLYDSKAEAQHPRVYPDELREIPWALPVEDALR